MGPVRVPAWLHFKTTSFPPDYSLVEVSTPDRAAVSASPRSASGRRPVVIGSDYRVSVPAWLRIVSNPQLKIGPTLPFIVGAIRDPIGDAPDSRATGNEELLELLRMMDEEAPADCGISIQWCPSVAAHVAACVTEPGLTWHATGFDATSRDALGAKLWDFYGDVITKGHYSKNGDWHRFTEGELKTIRTVLSGDA